MDYKLKIFKAVAQTESFSLAAKLLHISQPAVSKCVKNLEEKYGKAFFERNPNSINLTKEGELLQEYAERIIQLYEELEDEFLDGKIFSNEIRIGASTTIANYILPKLLITIQKNYPSLKINLMIGNTFDIQQAVLKKEINLGLVEGDNHNTRLQYSKFIEDELVLVSKYDQEDAETVSLTNLIKLPIVGREVGSGTREVIENALEKHNLIISEYHAVLGSTESIKNYLLNSNVFSILSIHSVEQELKSHQFRIIDVDDLEIKRSFFFITRQGYQSKLTTKIKNLLSNTYNQKE
jgi:DNA-binding transcriptional LysR family regulator